MRRIIAVLTLTAVMVMGFASTALADHNGPYCQVESLLGTEIFNTPLHDYCD